MAAADVVDGGRTRANRVAAAVIRRVDLLPRAAALGPVNYRPALVAFVAVVVCAAIALAALTVRPTADLGTVAVGGIVAFAMAAYAIRPLPAVQNVWTPSLLLQLGMSITLGPIGAVTGAVGEAAGFGLRTRNGWFRTGFNLANALLSNMVAYYVFAGIRGTGPASALVEVVAGLCAGVCHYTLNNTLLGVVLRIANPSTSFASIARSSLSALPYSVGYGVAAFAFVIMHQQAGVVGFAALLVPVILLQGFLILFARRVHVYEEQRAAYAKEREELLQQAVEASEAERRRIARDLHDGVVQNLAGMAFALSATASEIKGKGKVKAATESDTTMLELLEHSAEETRAAMKDLRTLIIELAPPTLRREGLHAALLEILRTLKQKGTKTRLDLPNNLRIREDRAALIFRVAQEVLRNVAAHAEAKNVTVVLKAEGGAAVLFIEDDGKGFSREQVARRRAQGHLGTTAIAELAEDADGSLEIDSAPGKGTRVTLRVPL
jgi:signal transduction histidine kinase